MEDKIISIFIHSIRKMIQNIIIIKIRFQFQPLKAIDLAAETTTVTHPTSFQQMKEKSYQKMSDFERDIKWFAYNCRITYPRIQKVNESASKLSQYFLEEIESILECAECYTNAYTEGEASFLTPCQQPHLLVWAYVEGYGFWPAKAMSINDTKVHVRFFGDHTTENVPFDACYLFSKKQPANPANCHELDSYVLASKVRYYYYMNI